MPKKSPAQLDREIAEALARHGSPSTKARELKIYAVDANIVSGIDGENVWEGSFEVPADSSRTASWRAVNLVRESTYYDPRIDPRVVLERVEHVGEVELDPSETPEQATAKMITEARKAIP